MLGVGAGLDDFIVGWGVDVSEASGACSLRRKACASTSSTVLTMTAERESGL